MNFSWKPWNNHRTSYDDIRFDEGTNTSKGGACCT